ncbi:class I SAM-dependent methyltransferase [Pseudooceanicola nanhaiensis]|uniref:class I SAM-dependent methyltransferase n=1 Tax=Pseudooceanicola nanhaiensis TaxID=375761 RepID=UPI001CD22B7D|nr:methyltransferase domain-containing protein [Pseudooceanicola nanhaiensis]MCA0921791.1 methyltransferase domain-containing protein [Pseudooceanicola nanhaiensis]
MSQYDAFADFEQAGWSDADIAQSYADSFAPASMMCVPAIVGGLGLEPGQEALDLCCGPGIVTAGLVATGAEVTALDFSHAMVELARTRVPDAAVLQGDAADLPFEPDTFDAVTIGFGLPHVPDPQAVLAEAHRVLRRGGRIAFSIWEPPARSFGFRTVTEALRTLGAPEITLPPAPDANALADPEVAFPALEAAGFVDPQAEPVDSHWRLDEPEDFYSLFHNGTVRMGVLMQRQPRDRAEAIRSYMADEVRAKCGRDAEGRWIVPLPAVVMSARA